MKRYLFVILLFFPGSLFAQESNSQIIENISINTLISPKKAMIIAESSPEVAALYSLDNQRFVNCIEKKVVKPCDSDGWVTCVENAWVAEFIVSQTCGVKNDGRLNEIMLIDGRDGKIISRFPEVSYYREPTFCQIDKDCMSSEEKNDQAMQCLNFVYGQISEVNFNSTGQCYCQDGHCALPKE